MLLGSEPRAWSHGHHRHENKHQSDNVAASQDAKIKEINNNYLINIKPIFHKKCFDCHSNQTRFPWYHKLPFIRGWLDSDVVEGSQHLEMTSDFPFGGHGDVKDDLIAIRESTLKGTMPPFAYRIVHPSSKISEEDKDQILKWITESETLLQKQN